MTPGGGEVERHVLVDGGNLVYRAFYSYVVARVQSGKPPLATSGGFETGTVYGALYMLGSWLHDMGRVTKVSVFFDGRPTRRLAVDPTYKSNRIEGPGPNTATRPVRLRSGVEDNRPLAVLRSVLGLLGVDVYHKADEEADDLIASFCASKPESVRMVVSDDKDFFQLLTDPRVVLYRPGSGHGSERFVDAEKAEAHWAKLQGGSHPPVPVAHVRMFKALCGDSSDGIKGVERMKKKVALTLCHHASVDELFAAGMPGLSESQRAKMAEARARIASNYDIVGMNSGIDLAPHLTPGRPDFGLARDIVHEDLEMDTVDLSAFRKVFKDPSADPFASPTPDWLAGI